MNCHKTPYDKIVICVIVLIILLFSCHRDLFAQDKIKITEPNWNQLLDQERKALLDKFIIEVVSSGSIGVIIDAQMLDVSTPGSNAGSQLGAAYGSAAYIDHAFQKNSVDYSATKDVTATLVGALIGGVLADSAPQPKFITRYTIKTLDGGIRYFEEVKKSGFRQSVGLCVSIFDISPVDQGLCNQTTEQIHSLYLTKAKPTVYSSEDTNENRKKDSNKINIQPAKKNGKEGDKVRCKFGTSIPVLIDRETCIKSQGEIINDQ